jgi:MSHA pilin protein MshD
MTRESGATLVEMVVSVVVISITVTGVMMVIYQTSGHSADPLIRTQAIAIAESYIEEILAQPLTDPAGGDTGGSESGETRSTFDDVTDYHGLADTAGALDQAGNAIAGLEGYNVTVQLTDATLNGDAAKRILVTVTHDGVTAFSFPLVAYRLN